MYTVYTATMANAHWPLAPIGQWASAMVAYTSDTHWVKALQCYTAIQRYTGQRAVEYTAIHRYTLYTLYNTPLAYGSLLLTSHRGVGGVGPWTFPRGSKRPF